MNVPPLLPTAPRCLLLGTGAVPTSHSPAMSAIRPSSVPQQRPSLSSGEQFTTPSGQRRTHLPSRSVGRKPPRAPRIHAQGTAFTCAGPAVLSWLAGSRLAARWPLAESEHKWPRNPRRPHAGVPSLSALGSDPATPRQPPGCRGCSSTEASADQCPIAERSTRLRATERVVGKPCVSLLPRQRARSSYSYIPVLIIH